MCHSYPYVLLAAVLGFRGPLGFFILIFNGDAFAWGRIDDWFSSAKTSTCSEDFSERFLFLGCTIDGSSNTFSGSFSAFFLRFGILPSKHLSHSAFVSWSCWSFLRAW